MGGNSVTLSKERIDLLAARTGFKQDMLEKASHLINLLDMIANDDYLKDRVVLKGGTALNLFYFELPRLSVDIDLNYTGSINPEVMKVEREQIERILSAICPRLQLQLAKLPDEYACRKYTASYHSHFSGRGNLHIDINYLHRVTYWEPKKRNSSALDTVIAKNVPVISLYQLSWRQTGCAASAKRPVATCSISRRSLRCFLPAIQTCAWLMSFTVQSSLRIGAR